MEVDEIYIGHDKTIKPKGQKKGRRYHHKNKVLSLVDRNSGQARSFVVDDVKARTLAAIVRANTRKEARLMTGEAGVYTAVGREFSVHGVVSRMSGEYGRGEVHTNAIEGFFSIFKRGMKAPASTVPITICIGIWQNMISGTTTGSRLALATSAADNLLLGVVGKKLTYETAP